MGYFMIDWGGHFLLPSIGFGLVVLSFGLLAYGSRVGDKQE
jgi:hypothetical protein